MHAQPTAKPKRDETVVINDDYEVPSLLHPMTGKIFVTNLEEVIRIRTGETGAEAV